MKQLIIILAVLTVSFSATAQQFTPTVIANGGGKISNSNVQMSYTTGEAVTGRISNGTVIFSEGFQQSSAGITVSITEKPFDNLKVQVFPNPSKDLINISLDNKMADEVIFQLYDVNGVLLFWDKCSDLKIEKQISLTSFVGNTFLLKISTTAEKQPGTFKIQKLN